MAQKVNPISLRLGKTNRNFDCCWYNNSNYVYLLMRDFKVKNYINFILKKINFSSARFLIQNLPNKAKINVFLCNSSKSRQEISRNFRINNYNKVKNSKKNLFSNNYGFATEKQNRIYNYLNKPLANQNSDLNTPGFYDNQLSIESSTAGTTQQRFSSAFLEQDFQTDSVTVKTPLKNHSNLYTAVLDGKKITDCYFYTDKSHKTDDYVTSVNKRVQSTLLQNLSFTEALRNDVLLQATSRYNGLYTTPDFIEKNKQSVDNINSKYTILNNYIKHSYVLEKLNQFFIQCFLTRYFSEQVFFSWYTGSGNPNNRNNNAVATSRFFYLKNLENIFINKSSLQTHVFPEVLDFKLLRRKNLLKTSFFYEACLKQVQTFLNKPSVSLYKKKQVLLKIFVNPYVNLLFPKHKKSYAVKNFMFISHKQKIYMSLISCRLQKLRNKKFYLNTAHFTRNDLQLNSPFLGTEPSLFTLAGPASAAIPSLTSYKDKNIDNTHQCEWPNNRFLKISKKLHISDRIAHIGYKICLGTKYLNALCLPENVLAAKLCNSGRSITGLVGTSAFYKKLSAYKNLKHSLKRNFMYKCLHVVGLPEKLHFSHILFPEFVNETKTVSRGPASVNRLGCLETTGNSEFCGFLSPLYHNKKFDILRAYYKITDIKQNLSNTNFNSHNSFQNTQCSGNEIPQKGCFVKKTVKTVFLNQNLGFNSEYNHHRNVLSQIIPVQNWQENFVPWHSDISSKTYNESSIFYGNKQQRLKNFKNFYAQQKHTNYIRLSINNMQPLDKTYNNYCNLSKYYGSCLKATAVLGGNKITECYFPTTEDHLKKPVKTFLVAAQKSKHDKIFSEHEMLQVPYFSPVLRREPEKTLGLLKNLSKQVFLSQKYKTSGAKYQNKQLTANSRTNYNRADTKLLLVNPPYKSHMESLIQQNFLCPVNLQFFKTTNIFQSALYLIDEVVFYIEKKVPFFKLKNSILRNLTQQKSLRIKGIRVMCSGRVGGKSKKAQKSKIQNFKYGETSLHMFSSKIDFQAKNAYTNFGTLGIKVWICYF